MAGDNNWASDSPVDSQVFVIQKRKICDSAEEDVSWMLLQNTGPVPTQINRYIRFIERHASTLTVVPGVSIPSAADQSQPEPDVSDVILEKEI